MRDELPQTVHIYIRPKRTPPGGEMHYLPHTVEETAWCLEDIRSPQCRWAFNYRFCIVSLGPVNKSIGDDFSSLVPAGELS